MTPYESSPGAVPPKSVRILSTLALAFGIASVCTGICGLDFAIAGIILANLSGINNGDVMPKRARVAQTLSIIGAVVFLLLYICIIVFVVQLFAELSLLIEEIADGILYYIVSG